jgi:hypothetical protein
MTTERLVQDRATWTASGALTMRREVATAAVSVSRIGADLAVACLVVSATHIVKPDLAHLLGTELDVLRMHWWMLSGNVCVRKAGEAAPAKTGNMIAIQNAPLVLVLAPITA